MSDQRRSTDTTHAKRRRLGTLLAGAVGALGLAGLVIALAVSLSVRDDRVDDVARLAQQIQQSRRESVLSTCRETNLRHDRTIRALDRVLEAASRNATVDERRDLQQRRASTVLLIAALAPKQNCKRRADRLVDAPSP